MNTEELREQTENTMHFDAHEFDGLREALENEGGTFLGQIDRFIRDNPFLCLGIAAAAGFGLAIAIGSQGRPGRASETAATNGAPSCCGEHSS
jgi:ElaB/YqjD/DUF883 family membrane-anchored ribosome-binding protein